MRDDGVGIPKEGLASIFEPFNRESHDLPRATGGLGIGLALVAQLVSLHGGRVEADSGGHGRGSEFTVILPLQSAGALPSRPSPPRSHGSQPARAQRVLVVDDNRDAADSLVLLLRARGIEVEVAHDGPAALEVAVAFAPTVVLLDLGMPGMDGFEVARRLRALASCRHARIVALTGWGQPDVKSRCHAAGFDDHVVKPIHLDTLEAVLAVPGRAEQAHPWNAS